MQSTQRGPITFTHVGYLRGRGGEGGFTTTTSSPIAIVGDRTQILPHRLMAGGLRRRSGWRGKPPRTSQDFQQKKAAQAAINPIAWQLAGLERRSATSCSDRRTGGPRYLGRIAETTTIDHSTTDSVDSEQRTKSQKTQRRQPQPDAADSTTAFWSTDHTTTDRSGTAQEQSNKTTASTTTSSPASRHFRGGRVGDKEKETQPHQQLAAQTHRLVRPNYHG